MQGDNKVLVHLNQVLTNELIAINQYFLHSRMYKNWGLEELAEFDYKESIDSMKRADKVIERILFLEGLPNLQDLGKLHIGENTQEMLAADLSMEMGALVTLRETVKYCEEIHDYVSRDLAQDFIEEEEEHVDNLETQIELIEKVGIKNYLQSKMDN
ncbi:MAG: bacterioferritin [Saccharospirillaceae bacterium]|nr:bacterioferritin [Pseudomonadales bacterium]NRB81264.1 bacterioferritin [Saccharospirillaceae bacterium]